MTAPPRRIETHRIDTLAVRRLMSLLSADWIIRDLSERDYGIDLMLEYFDGERPTGKTAFFQVKGQRDPIAISRANTVNFHQFPVKTLLYAEHFPEPFFLVHLSIERDEPIYFLWLQRYIQLELDNSQPDWRDLDDVTLRIPVGNNFLTEEGRVLDIVSRNVMLKKAMRFLTDYYYWDKHIDELIEAENLLMKDVCISFVEKFKTYTSFFVEIIERIGGTFELEFDQAITHIHTLHDFHSDYETKEWLRSFREDIANIFSLIMMQEDIEEAALEFTGDAPY